MSSLARTCGLNKSQRPSNDVDRLSNLPDSVLCHILSLLSTEDVVATSVLSRRWKFLWTNIYNLIFTDDFTSRSSRDATKDREIFFFLVNKDREIKFAHFVNKVLLFLNQQTIHKFSFVISGHCKVYDVTTWIAAAVVKNLKVLEFFVDDPYPYDSRIMFPCSLFTCKTLEVLKLFDVKNLNVPSLVCFPNLKTLELHLVAYQSDESFKNLISGCLSLETLYIVRFTDDNAVTCIICSPTLTSLTFEFYDPNILYLGELGDKLEIDAPALRYLNLRDSFSRDFSVENLCLLDEAGLHTINIKDEDEDVTLIHSDHYSNLVVKLLQGVYNVKHLSLSGHILEALSYAGACPCFPRLTRLTVKANCYKWNSLLNLVEGSNKLMFLSFSKDFDHNGTPVTSWNKLEKVPIYLLSCLKTMSFHGFAGLKYELAMVAFILENAKVLRTMTIKAADPLDLEARFQLLQKVAKFPRGSIECEITFT